MDTDFDDISDPRTKGEKALNFSSNIKRFSCVNMDILHLFECLVFEPQSVTD